jgi:hypothetical protein
MGREPPLHGLDVVCIQHVDHRSAFEVHHNRAVVQPFALRPFIHADVARIDDRGSRALLRPAHNRVVTHREAEAPHEPFTGPSAERVADQLRHHIRPACAAAMDLRHARQRPGEKKGPRTPAADIANG